MRPTTSMPPVVPLKAHTLGGGQMLVTKFVIEPFLPLLVGVFALPAGVLLIVCARPLLEGVGTIDKRRHRIARIAGPVGQPRLGAVLCHVLAGQRLHVEADSLN